MKQTVKKILAGVSLMAFLVAAVPQKTHAQVLEGALIGGAVGGVVGVFLHFMKPDAAEDPVPSSPSGQADTASSAAARPVFLPGAEVIEEAEATTAN